MVALIVLLRVPPLAAAADSGVGPNTAALFILPTNDLPALQRFITELKSLSGRADHVFPPNAVIGHLPFDFELALRQRLPGLRIERSAIAVHADQALASGAEIATHVWNSNFMKLPAAMIGRDRGRVRRMPPNDARFVPGRELSNRPRASAEPAAAAPGVFETSEFFIGSVTVTIITPESNGAIDVNRENWSAARQNTVVAKISEGLQWWKDNTHAPADLSFVYDIKHSQATSYEPIHRSSADEGLWIAEIMTNLGFPGSNYFTQVSNYLHNRRGQLGTDWAIAIFVVDSNNDADGEFSNGSFAYSYVNGPFTIMTYDNDSWGISGMNNVTAHENGHLWGALDEYASSGCTTSETSGYLNIANTNCENGSPTEDSIMRNAADQTDIAYPNHLVSTPARQMVGWRDSDGDGKELYDPVDTIPSVSLTPFSPDPTTDSTPTYTGTAQDIATVSPTHPDVTINKIVSVEWRVDGGPWQAATPMDGAFDSDLESFTFTAPVLSIATHTFQARATNSVGNVSTIASDTLTLIANPALPTVTLTTTTPNASENLTNGVITVSRTGSTTAPLTVNYTVGGTATPGADYVALSGSATIPAGASSVTIDIVPIDDLIVESSETVIVSLSLSATYNLGAQTGGTVTINDNDSFGAVIGHVNCSSGSLQSVIDAALPGMTIVVGGACSENILIRNEAQRTTIDGGGTAIINAPNSAAPAFNVRGKGILITGLTISGGSDGVHVNRGSNAVIENNLIQNSTGTGVTIDESAVAVLVGNTIQNHPEAGVFVSENSTARIGFNSDSELVASANNIQNNGVGIVVSNQSSARIVGNTIQNNTGDGVHVLRDSQADIADNNISANGGDGIEVGENSVIQLGEANGTSIFELPNATTGANGGVGVRCLTGSVADGNLGGLIGSAGSINFAVTCIDSLLP